jgi:DNA invertase Pin-like site-specific DNA recombinase
MGRKKSVVREPSDLGSPKGGFQSAETTEPGRGPAAGPPTALRTALSDADRQALERWARAPTSAQRLVRRSRIILLLAEGQSLRAVARELGVTRATVALWRARFAAGGPQALSCDAVGRGRPLSLSAAQRFELRRLRDAGLLHGEHSATNLARRWGVSRATVFRTLKKVAEVHH